MGIKGREKQTYDRLMNGDHKQRKIDLENLRCVAIAAAQQLGLGDIFNHQAPCGSKPTPCDSTGNKLGRAKEVEVIKKALGQKEQRLYFLMLIKELNLLGYLGLEHLKSE